MLASAVKLECQIGSHIDCANVGAGIDQIWPAQETTRPSRDQDEVGADVHVIVGHLRGKGYGTSRNQFRHPVTIKIRQASGKRYIHQGHVVPHVPNLITCNNKN